MHKARVLIPLPTTDYDPTESAVPWMQLRELGHEVVLSTPDGAPAQADPRMVDGRGLGIWRGVLPARADARRAYEAMASSEEMRSALPWSEIDVASFDGLLLPGGHAPGMRTYLESERLQSVVVAFFDAAKPVGAICHGVLLAARSRRADGRSVLHGRQTTALTAAQERLAWAMTRLWLGDYYRTYPQTVEDEVVGVLADPKDFHRGPPALLRDTPSKLGRGFVVHDGSYVSARWPGDVYSFTAAFVELLEAYLGS